MFAYFSSFSVLATLEESVEFADKQFLSSCQIVTSSNSQGKIRVLHSSCDVLDNRFVINTDGQNLKV